MAEISGNLPTQLAALKTLNIVHILEQLHWKEHLFNYDKPAKKKNVRNFFYRIEFQGRGTAHIHLLIWLAGLSKCSYADINAHILTDDRELSFLVYDLQQSNATVLPCNENATCITRAENGKQHLSLYYPQNAFGLKLRAYISSLLPFLKCHMDVQFSDHCGMLMRYITNYVLKFHKDSQTTKSLYSPHLNSAQAAYRHLRDMKPCEPEMVMTLSSIKMAWSNNSTKSYVPPRPSSAATNTTLVRYHQRSIDSNVHS